MSSVRSGHTCHSEREMTASHKDIRWRLTRLSKIIVHLKLLLCSPFSPRKDRDCAVKQPEVHEIFGLWKTYHLNNRTMEENLAIYHGCYFIGREWTGKEQQKSPSCLIRWPICRRNTEWGKHRETEKTETKSRKSDVQQKSLPNLQTDSRLKSIVFLADTAIAAGRHKVITKARPHPRVINRQWFSMMYLIPRKRFEPTLFGVSQLQLQCQQSL